MVPADAAARGGWTIHLALKAQMKDKHRAEQVLQVQIVLGKVDSILCNVDRMPRKRRVDRHHDQCKAPRLCAPMYLL